MVEIDDIFDKDGGEGFARGVDFVEVAVLDGEEIVGIVVKNLNFGEIAAEFTGEIDAVFGIFDI